jgi:hypothetical protein
MHRRNFFRSLALLAGATSVCPNIFIPKFEPVKWKVIHYTSASPSQGLFVINSFFGTWEWKIEDQWAIVANPETCNYFNLWTPNPTQC